MKDVASNKEEIIKLNKTLDKMEQTKIPQDNEYDYAKVLKKENRDETVHFFEEVRKIIGIVSNNDSDIEHQIKKGKDSQEVSQSAQ